MYPSLPYLKFESTKYRLIGYYLIFWIFASHQRAARRAAKKKDRNPETYTNLLWVIGEYNLHPRLKKLQSFLLTAIAKTRNFG